MAKTIVTGYDGSAHGKVALKRTVELADAGDTAVVISVAPYEPTPADLVIRKNALAEAETMLAGSSVTVNFVEATGNAERLIVDEAIDTNADVVVVGSRGRTGLAATLLGSVSSHVAHHAPCDVLIARERD